jgi:UPF0716 family protein affecting phage T7 exclusion
MRHTPVHPVSCPAQVAASPSPVNGGAHGGLAPIARAVAGAVLLLVGAAMLALPGPGVIVIVTGLSLLAVDYAWARHLRARAAERLVGTGRTVRRAVTGHRSRRRDADQGDGAAHAGQRDMRNRHSRRGAEHLSTEVSS